MPSHLAVPVPVGSILTTSSSLTLANGEYDSVNFSFSELEGRDSAERVRYGKNVMYFNNNKTQLPISCLDSARDP